MKDNKIRILSIITSVFTLIAVIPVMFSFYEDVINGINVTCYGFNLYSNTKSWWFILLAVLGIISFIWNLAYGAYAIIDGRYRNLTWRIARYGYFYGIITGIINFSAIISLVSYCYLLPSACVFLLIVAATVALEITLLFLKDEDTKRYKN